MAAEWASYGTPDARAITEAFVAGINAWIALTERRTRSRCRPNSPPWAPARPLGRRADVVRIRSHGRVRNASPRWSRAQVTARADLQADLLRRSIDPPLDAAVPTDST